MLFVKKAVTRKFFVKNTCDDMYHFKNDDNERTQINNKTKQRMRVTIITDGNWQNNNITTLRKMKFLTAVGSKIS